MEPVIEAVVGVQNQVGGADALAPVGAFEDPGGALGGLRRLDLPAIDLAAVDVEDKEEAEEGPAHGGGHIIAPEDAYALPALQRARGCDCDLAGPLQAPLATAGVPSPK